MADKVGFKQGTFTTEADVLSKLNTGDMFVDTGSNGTGIYLCGSNADGTKKLYNIAYGKKQYDEVKLDATYECISIDSGAGEYDVEFSVNVTADQISAFEDPSRKIFVHNSGYGCVAVPVTIDMDTNKVAYRFGFAGDVYSFRIKNGQLMVLIQKLASILEDGSVSKSRLSTDVQTSLGKADNSLQICAINPGGDYLPTVLLGNDFYGGLEVRDASDTNISNYQKPNAYIRKNEIGIVGKNTDLERGISINADGLEINGRYIGSHFIGLGENNKLKLGGTSLTSKETLGGVATPVEDNDAANKAYVDGKVELTNDVLSNMFYALKLHYDNTDEHIADNVNRIDAFYQTINKCLGEDSGNPNGFPIALIYSDEDGEIINYVGYALYDNNYIVGTVYNGNFDLCKVTVNEGGKGRVTITTDMGYATKDVLLYLLDPIHLYYDNSEDSKTANIRAIKTRMNSLKLNGIDESSTPMIPVFLGDEETEVGYIVRDKMASCYKGFVAGPIYTENKNKGKSIVVDDYGEYYEYEFVDQSTLATSLQAITIYTDNTAAHRAQNLANIKAYEDNLKAMGVDVTKNHPVMANISNDANWKGYLYGGTSNNRYDGVVTVDNQPKVCIIANDGTYIQQTVLIDYSSSLSTSSKAITGAINEVNTLAKSKASTAVATTSANGLMSSGDKVKLDGLSNAEALTNEDIDSAIK